MSGAEAAREWGEAEFEAALARAAGDGTVVAANVRISAERLADLLGAATNADAERPGSPQLGTVDFSGAVFIGDAAFEGATFSGDATFKGATFSGDATFNTATFSGDVTFAGARFGGDVNFGVARFSGDANFDDAMFGGDATFNTATFSDGAAFRGVMFTGSASFYKARFERFTLFLAATFGGDAYFGYATFPDRVLFDATTFTGDVSFVHATFAGSSSFERVTFAGGVRFDVATFTEHTSFRHTMFTGRDASFAKATFSDNAAFDAAAFTGPASFLHATFARGAVFDTAMFAGQAQFLAATFSYASFVEATFGGEASFNRATFADAAHFDWATFSGVTHFARATFARDAEFAGAVFTERAEFAGSRFDEARTLGPILVSEALELDDAVFARHVRIEVSARHASFTGVAFLGGADVFVRWAEVLIDGADFAAPSLLAELPMSATRPYHRAFLGREKPLDESRLRPPLDAGWFCPLDAPPERAPPRLLSLRGAKVAQLTLSEVDLHACRFAGAHGLDGLRLEGVRFAQPPDGWQRLRARRWVRWTRRRTVAEEHQWRATHGFGAGWYRAEEGAKAPVWLDGVSESPTAEQIARVYRDLRKAHEDSKDEPGAADFYYGEMEMRRHSDAPRGERAILWLYWLVSGYGLRATRALLALAVTIALLALPLELWGFRLDRSYWRALLFSVESSISLLRAPTAKLTAGGEVIQIVLRLAGPLFFGLALLALRGRVKR